MTIRCATFLAAEDGEPGLPRSLFAGVVDDIARAVGMTASLELARCGSGPRSAADDPFAAGTTDLAWVCAPSMLWLHEAGSIDLLPASMVLDDPRCGGRPTYLCEVVVRNDNKVARVEDLQGSVVAYNDRASLSGFGSIVGRVAPLGGLGFFARWLETGTHARSIEALLAGTADLAVVDANVWRAMPRSGLRVLETLGPFPIQPIVVRRGWQYRQRVADALLSWRPPDTGMLRGFARVSTEDIRAGVPWGAIQDAWQGLDRLDDREAAATVPGAGLIP